MMRREPTTGHGQLDRDRYLQKIRDRLQKALPTIPGDAPIISGDPNTPVTVPIPGGGIGLPRFIPQRPPEPLDGWGQGPAQPGDILARVPGPRGGNPGSGDEAAGQEAGDHDIAVTLPLQEWRRLILEDLRLPDLHPGGLASLTDPTTVWISRSRMGSLSALDKRATLKEALARSQAQRQPLTFAAEDLRYHSWQERPRPQTAAVVYLLRDISGSMGGEWQYLARATAWYLVAVLQHAYATCPVEFWVHDTRARRVTEAEFLGLEAQGGTAGAPAYTAMQAAMDHEYPAAAYNRYCFHFTDGDIWDAEATLPIARAWAPTLRRLGVVILRATSPWPAWIQTLAEEPTVRAVHERQRSDVVEAVRTLLRAGEGTSDAG